IADACGNGDLTGRKIAQKKALKRLGVHVELPALPKPRAEIPRHRPSLGRHAVSACRVASAWLKGQISLREKGRLKVQADPVGLRQLDGGHAVIRKSRAAD